jgi:Mrp family chromosome partitioning ATPase
MNNFPDLLEPAWIINLLGQLSAHYDIILIDAPAILAVSDAAMLAPYVDGVLLTVKMGATHKEALGRAIQQLEAIQAPVIGTVLNRAQPNSRYQSYSGYYEIGKRPEQAPPNQRITLPDPNVTKNIGKGQNQNQPKESASKGLQS